MRRQSATTTALARGIVLLVVAAGAALLASIPASARVGGYVPEPDCHVVKFIGVRGSGDGSSTLGVIATSVANELAKKARARGVDFSAYGLPYAAVGIDWWKIVANTQLPLYRLSEREGRNNLRTLIREQARDCPSEKLVIGGYSQGAHAVGDVFSKGVGGLSPGEQAHVKAVALLADPRFNSQESFVKGSFRVGRNGVLGARSPGDLVSIGDRLRSWCRKDDLICQGPGTTTNHHQDKYLADYQSAVVPFLADKLGWTAPAAPLPLLWNGHANGKASLRPSSIIVTCADGGEYVVHWSSWTDSKAVGSGTTRQCRGPEAHVSLVATRPVRGWFTRLKVSLSGPYSYTQVMVLASYHGDTLLGWSSEAWVRNPDSGLVVWPSS